MHVVLVEQPCAPHLSEFGGPLLSGPLARPSRHLVQLPIEDRQLVRLAALIARAAEAVAQRQLDDVSLVRSNEAGAGDALARELLQRLERTAQMRPHERPPQAPRILRIDVTALVD